MADIITPFTEDDFETLQDHPADHSRALSRNVALIEFLRSVVNIKEQFGLSFTSPEREALIQAWSREHKEDIDWCIHIGGQAEKGFYPPSLPEIALRSDLIVGSILPDLLANDS